MNEQELRDRIHKLDVLVARLQEQLAAANKALEKQAQKDAIHFDELNNAKRERDERDRNYVHKNVWDASWKEWEKWRREVDARSMDLVSRREWEKHTDALEKWQHDVDRWRWVSVGIGAAAGGGLGALAQIFF